MADNLLFSNLLLTTSIVLCCCCTHIYAQKVDTIIYPGGRYKLVFDLDAENMRSPTPPTLVQSAFKSYTRDSLLWAYKIWGNECISYAIYDYSILKEYDYRMKEIQIRDTCLNVDISIIKDSMGNTEIIDYGSPDYDFKFNPTLDFSRKE